MSIKLVKFQRTRERVSTKKYSDHQRYFDQRTETIEANPDQLAAAEPEIQLEELIAILSVLDDGGEKILTPKQRRAFQLVVREGLSTRDAAKKMRCSYQNVQQFVESAAVKLRKLTLSKRCLDGLECRDTEFENEGC